MEHRNLVDGFPGLKQAFATGLFEGESKGAVESLMKVPFGYAFITGGPGSGKTSLALRIVKAVVSDGVDQAAFNVPDDKPDDEGDGESESVISKTVADTQDAGWGDTAANTTEGPWDEKMDALEESDDQGWTRDPDAQAWEEPTATAYDMEAETDAAALDFTVSPGFYLKEHDTPSAEAPKSEVNLTAKAAWIAPSNTLVDDATRRAHRECPDKIVVQVLSWKVEMDNLMSAEPAQAHLINTAEAPLASSASRLLAEHTNGYAMTCFEERSPSKVFRSLSEFARTVAEQEGDKWSDYWKAINEKLHDPDTFVLNKQDHDEVFQKLMERAISFVDIACGTPCALAELANHSSWVPDLIVTDEAARLSEAMSLLLQSKWPRAVGIFIGDTKQLQPLTEDKDQDDVKPVFSRQREASLLKRMEDTGRLTFVLRLNHRAFMTAAGWAQKEVYGKQMSIVHRRHTPATRAFIDWTFQAFNVRSTTIMIRPWNSCEAKIGDSFANGPNANFVSQLIIQLYRQAGLMNAYDAEINTTASSDEDKVRVRRASILIITPYAAQRRAYHLVLRQMSDAEIPTSLVEVRTIDSSSGHEADVVIIDCVRTTKMGFVSDIHRMSVMMTRARIGTILVGTTSKMGFPSTFKSLIKYLVDRNSLIDHSKLKIRTKWDKMCGNCIQPGHTASVCPFKPECQTCEGARHATRHCPKSREDAISVYADEPVRADDGIGRDCLARQ
ncbi:hypothetical protein FDECE_7730 [Fusarium decemcellulare]|nr:hypothetical protein FDECE_7730 [Fusarium decemcellulare]